MDSFFEKLTGRFNSGEVIKANAEADAKELEKAREKANELEKAVSDMRRLSLKAVETHEATTQLVASAIEKIEEVRAVGGSLGSEDIDKITSGLEDLKSTMEASFKASGEEAHMENVRVYRNVQASLIEELKQQSEAIAIQHLHLEKKLRGIKPCAIIALVFSGISMVGVGVALYILITQLGF
ncbi:MAG: hypothetical protein J5626_08395 [Lachnospiraceae bacterium]|nr:hypothetical protein [Lachnospiraceae bacterium]